MIFIKRLLGADGERYFSDLGIETPCIDVRERKKYSEIGRGGLSVFQYIVFTPPRWTSIGTNPCDMRLPLTQPLRQGFVWLEIPWLPYAYDRLPTFDT